MESKHKILNIGTACTGCFACSNACPKDAIALPENNEGFYHPVIDTEKCIDCGLCDKICPRIEEKEYHMMQCAYYGWTNNSEARKNSSSGGVFNLLSNEILSNGGIVYGASFNYSGEIRLECHSNEEVTLQELQRSKYVQSHIGYAYRKIKRDLTAGRQVLFCGTPCQVDGLKSFLRKEYDNLVTVDFVCHGVPSMSLLRKHLAFLGLKDITDINFRPKNRTWVDDLKITHKKGIRNTPWAMDEYFYTFEKYRNIRPSCFECKHCNGKRAADITLADFWGIYKYKPQEFDPKGISLIMANTIKGKGYIETCIAKEKCNFKELPLQYATYVYEKDRTLKGSSYDRSKRDKFIADVYTIGYKSAIKEHGYYISPLKRFSYNTKLSLRLLKAGVINIIKKK
ncbi:MAG: Coenzyme F420 hydrogenase/dehydrogenase, beta subunit C-terminal domain [Bacteroidaceae bacterium]|nr:Coenzyme F420 hydrogenase/dehydrogenase, beta subunit C-terminal domain [Bacteroidaceae bacterium]